MFGSGVVGLLKRLAYSIASSAGREKGVYNKNKTIIQPILWQKYRIKFFSFLLLETTITHNNNNDYKWELATRVAPTIQRLPTVYVPRKPQTKKKGNKNEIHELKIEPILSPLGWRVNFLK